jgi:hypothetical protein
VRGLQLVFTVCGSNQSALRQTQQFLAEFDALAQELSKAELAAQPFLQAFKARARRQFREFFIQCFGSGFNQVSGSGFEVLDVLFGGLKASSVAWTSFLEA